MNNKMPKMLDKQIEEFICPCCFSQWQMTYDIHHYLSKNVSTITDYCYLFTDFTVYITFVSMECLVFVFLYTSVHYNKVEGHWKIKIY